jgi:hypothetical protein
MRMAERLHEPDDFGARRIAYLGGGLLVSMTLISAILLAVLHAPGSAQRNATIVGTDGVPSPHLQMHPSGDYARYLDEKRAQLTTTGWVDREHGIVHVPIERAMDDIARAKDAKR